MVSPPSSFLFARIPIVKVASFLLSRVLIFKLFGLNFVLFY